MNSEPLKPFPFKNKSEIVFDLITLNDHVRKNKNMLSNICARWCCQIERINENKLREMSLKEIFAIPGAGDVAQREIMSFRAAPDKEGE